GKFKNSLISLDDSDLLKPRNAVDMPRRGRKGDSCSRHLLLRRLQSSTTWGMGGGLEGAHGPEFIAGTAETGRPKRPGSGAKKSCRRTGYNSLMRKYRPSTGRLRRHTALPFAVDRSKKVHIL